MAKGTRRPKRIRTATVEIHFSPLIAYRIPREAFRQLRELTIVVGRKIVPVRGKRDEVRRLIIDGAPQ